MVGVLIVLGLMVLGTFMVTPRGFSHFVFNSANWVSGKVKRQPTGEIPLPTPSVTPRLNTQNSETEEIPHIFPRYKPEPKLNPPKSINSPAQGNWLWDRLHPKPEPQLVAPIVPPAFGVGKGVLSETAIPASAEGPEIEAKPAAIADLLLDPELRVIRHHCYKPPGILASHCH